jgi:hypothetical protein
MTILSVPEPVESSPQDSTSPAEYYDSENPPFVAAESYYGEEQATPTPVVLSTTAQVTSAPVAGQSGTSAPPPGQSDRAMLMRKRIIMCISVLVGVGFIVVNRSFIF